MNPRDLIPTADQIKSVQSIESQLLQRRTKGMFGFVVGIAGALLQVVLAVAQQENYITNLGQLFTGLRSFQLYQLATPKALGFFAIVLGFGAYLIFRRTSLLFKESKEPFQYTFWIDAFADAGEKPAAGVTREVDSRLHLLHHDLMERLNDRIPRLSLLNQDTGSGGPIPSTRMKSHINISGHYALRDLNDDPDWAIQVMPRIRIGSQNEPATLAHPVRYLVADKSALPASSYYQLVERVYSSIATEVYRQIENDVKEKMYLFPTNYLRAVAYYYEAEDFARSNTIDAYDRAIDLYRDAVRYFNIGSVRWISQTILRIPLIWRLKIKSKHMQARVQIGYAKCLIYRRQISALTGRRMNPLYEIHESVEQVVRDLERLHGRIARFRKTKRSNFLMAVFTFPKDSWLRSKFRRPMQPLFERQKHILFDAHVVAALANSHLGATARAEDHLRDAAAVDPALVDRNALFLLAAGEVEPDLEKGMLLYRQATEVAPDFQIAQHLLAQSSQLRFRERGELVMARADSVLAEYDAVLEINPGNIAALAAQGYVWWLLDDSDPERKKACLSEARRKFEEGREIKAVVRDTFVGELNYGLARVAAEEGRFNTSYDLLGLAVASDPGIGAYATTASQRPATSYFEFISPAVLQRFRRFKNQVKRYRLGKDPLATDHQTASERVRRALYSFALNDYGSACLNYYLRFGTPHRLRAATKAFQAAIGENPNNLVAKYNLHFAYRWGPGDEEAPLKLLEEVVAKLPNWQAAVISLTQSHSQGPRVRRLRRDIEQTTTEINKQVELAREAREKSARLNSDLKLLKKQSRKSLKPKPAAAVQDNWAHSTGIKAGTRQGPAAAYELGLEGIEGSEQEKLENEIAQADKEAGQHRKLAEDLRRNKLNKSEEELRQLTRDTLGRVVKNTKLSSLFEESEIDYAGKQVDRLLSNRRIRWERLDEYDVEALAAWADALSSNTQDPAAVKASIRLCKHLLRQYHPDNFELTRILESLARARQLSLDSDEEKRAFRDMLNRALAMLNLIRRSQRVARVDPAKIEEIIKRVVLTWLRTDPIHYMALDWHHQYFDADAHLEAMRKALEIVHGDKSYRRNLVRRYAERMNRYLAGDLGQSSIVGLDDSGENGSQQNDDKSAGGNSGESGSVDYDADGKIAQPDSYSKAFSEYEMAVEVAAFQADGRAVKVPPNISSQYSALASGWAGFRGAGKRVDAINVALSALDKACKLDPNGDNQKQVEQLQLHRTIGKHFGERSLDRGPFLTSVVIGIAPNLIPHVADENREVLPWLLELLNQVNKDIQTSMGIVVPPAIFRSLPLSDGSYNILINDLPFATGRIGEGERLFPGTAGDLNVLGVVGSAVTEPHGRAEAVWVAKKDWQVVEASGYTLWQIPEYIVRHFESVMQSNLAEFVGHNEVATMLADQAPALDQDIITNPPRLGELTGVVRRLLSESVPITAFAAIAEKFNGLRDAGMDLPSIIETIRSSSEICRTLPGNNDSYGLYGIRGDLESAIGASIHRGGAQPILALEPQQYQLVAGAFRKHLVVRKPMALVVENPELRPFVRDLIRLEFPLVPVLSLREVLPASRRTIKEVGF